MLPALLTDAISRFRTLRRNARLYLISNTIQAASAGALGVLYTLYLSSLGFGKEFIGQVVVLGAIGGAVGILPANPLVRRLGWRTMLLWSDMIGGVAIAVQLLVPTRPVILVTTLGIGASVAIVLVINTPLLTAYSTAHERTALFGLSNALGLLATISGSLLGGFLPGVFQRADVRGSALLHTLGPLLVPEQHDARAYQLALLVTGIVAVPSVLPVLLMRNEPGVSVADAPASGEDTLAYSTRLPWRERVARVRSLATGVVGRFCVTQSLVGFGAGIFFPYASLYFVKGLGATTGFYGVLSAALAVVVALSSLLAAPLADRFGKLRSAVVAQFCSVPFLLAIGAFPIVGVAAVALLTRGFLMSLTGPPLQTYLMEGVPDETRVTASSVYNVSYQIAWALGAGVGGYIAAVNLRLPFIAAAPCYALGAVLLLRWFAHRRVPQPHVAVPVETL